MSLSSCLSSKRWYQRLLAETVVGITEEPVAVAADDPPALVRTDGLDEAITLPMTTLPDDAILTIAPNIVTP